MQQIILIIHVLAALGIVALVLLQHGKGADAGASFGAGSANTMLGSAGALPFMLKITAGLGLIFFITSITLAHMTATAKKAQSVISMPGSTPSVVLPPVPTASPSSDTKVKSGSSANLKPKSTQVKPVEPKDKRVKPVGEPRKGDGTRSGAKE